MQGVCLTVAYDGTQFHGYQSQDGLPCIQSELQRALGKICNHDVLVRGTSRTDAGVHALCQVVAFDTSRELDPRRWAQAINRYLPPTIAVQDTWKCEPGYTPRFDATSKLYRYLFHLGAVRDPLLINRAWHLGRQIPYKFPEPKKLHGGHHRLDMQAMARGCTLFEGTHDFGAFRASTDTRENTVRTMLRLQLFENYVGNADLLALEVEGTGFMKNMVRIIAGTVIAVGSRRISLTTLSTLLQPGACRTRAGDTAPPEGLTLVSVSLGQDGTTHGRALHSTP